MLSFRGKFFILLYWILMICSSSWAARNFGRNAWKIRLGGAVSNVLQRIDAPTGFESKVSQIQGIAGLQRQIFLSKKVGIAPDIHLWLPWRNGADGTTLTFTSHFGIPLFWEFLKVFQILGGPGIFWESHFSREQAISLGNGGGSSLFYTPWRSRQVVLLSVFGGLNVELNKQMGLFLGVIAPQFMSSEKRRFHALGGITIKL